MRPNTTREPGAEDNACPSYMHLSAASSTPGPINDYKQPALNYHPKAIKRLNVQTQSIPNGYIAFLDAIVKYNKSRGTILKYIRLGEIDSCIVKARRYVDEKQLAEAKVNIETSVALLRRKNLTAPARLAKKTKDGYVLMSEYCREINVEKSRIRKAVKAGNIEHKKIDIYTYVKPESVLAYIDRMDKKHRRQYA